MPEIIKLSQKELNQVSVIKKVAEGKLKQIEAAESLGITDRQIRRLLNKYRDEGNKSFASKLRCRPSNHQLDKGFKDKGCIFQSKNIYYVVLYEKRLAPR